MLFVLFILYIYIYISLKYNATDRLLNPHVIHELQLMWIVPEGSSVGSSHWANVTTCSCWFQTDGLAATCSRDPYLLKSDFFQEGIILKCHVKIMLFNHGYQWSIFLVIPCHWQAHENSILAIRLRQRMFRGGIPAKFALPSSAVIILVLSSSGAKGGIF